MNPIIKFILNIPSKLGISMNEDYEFVRNFQSFFSNSSNNDFLYLDRKIYAEDTQHEIKIRVFYPNDKIQGNDSIIFIHGGGWTIGDIETYSGACQNIADEFKMIVYSVDYRLAPEHQFPASFDDSLKAVEVIMEREHRMENQQWILMGDSAGANLAAAINLKLKEENRRLPEKQILFYPATYFDHSSNSPFESVEENGYDYGLTKKQLQEFMDNYVPNEENRKDKRVAPLMAEDLSNQPETLIITAEHDPLRDEGEAYGVALKEAGNEVSIHRILESVHGFIKYPPSSGPLREAFEVMHQFLD